jgi:hypothetical protein
MKIAALGSPLKYKNSEKIRESNAEINNNLSVSVNFLNIFLVVVLNKNISCKYKRNVVQNLFLKLI